MQRGLSEIIGSMITTMIVISLFVAVYVTAFPSLESFVGDAIYSTQRESQEVQEDLVIEQFAVNSANSSAVIYVANVGLVPSTVTQVFVNGHEAKVDVNIGVSETARIVVPVGQVKPPYYVVLTTDNGYSTSVTWP